MKKGVKRLIIIFLGIASLYVYAFTNGYFFAKKEYRSALNFVINKLDVSAKGAYTFTDRRGNDIDIGNYDSYRSLKIQKGDSIAKKAYDKTLYIYRKDSAGAYKVYLTLQPLQHYEFYDDPNFK